MSLALYMDMHVPAAITRALRRRGVDVLTAHDDGAARLLDPALLDRAAALGRLVFTSDSDFLAEGVYAHQQDVSIGRCVSDPEMIALATNPEEATGQIIYLPL